MYRKATLNDCEMVYKLICDMECKQLPFEKFFVIYREQMSNRHYYCLIREQENNVVGVLNLRLRNNYIILNILQKLWNLLLIQHIGNKE